MAGVRLRPVALVAALLTLVCAAPAWAIPAEQLRGRLTAYIGAAGGSSGAFAQDLDTGRVIVSVRASTPRIPASVQKLFTTATTLLRFGPEGVLETSAVAGGAPDDEGIVSGDLYLVGGGDPTLDTDGLRRLAREVRAAGVRSISGGVVADESRFDRLRGTPRTRGAIDYDLGGRLGALVVGRGYQDDPALTVGREFAKALRRAGVVTRARTRRGRAPSEALSVPLATLASPPVSSLAAATLIPSDNFLAEMLLKDLGASFGAGGTSRAGAAVVRSTLRPLGVSARIADGSGLSRANRVSPREVVELFDAMADDPAGAVWRAAMAVPGRTGTVSRRMRGTLASRRCRVKTGTLNGVSTLAGVCATPGGDVGFAWLMNRVSISGAHRLQDKMTTSLARYTG
jgi:D-alanyl-D-alanine carboxypeptidase/D-alanyl-D-alanine-endopeptidase (penicillin-binding protein 4)